MRGVLPAHSQRGPGQAWGGCLRAGRPKTPQNLCALSTRPVPAPLLCSRLSSVSAARPWPCEQLWALINSICGRRVTGLPPRSLRHKEALWVRSPSQEASSGQEVAAGGAGALQVDVDMSGVRTRLGGARPPHRAGSGLPGPGWGGPRPQPLGTCQGGEGPRASEEGRPAAPLCAPLRGAAEPARSRLLPQEQRLPGTSAVAMATTEVLTG